MLLMNASVGHNYGVARLNRAVWVVPGDDAKGLPVFQRPCDVSFDYSNCDLVSSYPVA